MVQGPARAETAHGMASGKQRQKEGTWQRENLRPRPQGPTSSDQTTPLKSKSAPSSHDPIIFQKPHLPAQEASGRHLDLTPSCPLLQVGPDA